MDDRVKNTSKFLIELEKVKSPRGTLQILADGLFHQQSRQRALAFPSRSSYTGCSNRQMKMCRHGDHNAIQLLFEDHFLHKPSSFSYLSSLNLIYLFTSFRASAF